ncbi:TPA: hypothetical protein ACX6Q6_003567 [Photobacterium damselae]
MNTAELTRLILRSNATSTLTSSELLIVLTIVDRGNPHRDNGLFQVWYSAEELGKLAGLSRSTAFRTFTSIKKYDVSPLVITKRQGNNGVNSTNIYTVNPEWINQLGLERITSVSTASSLQIKAEPKQSQTSEEVVSKVSKTSPTMTPEEDNKENNKENNSTTELDFNFWNGLKSFPNFDYVRELGLSVKDGWVYESLPAIKKGKFPVGYMSDNFKVSKTVREARLQYAA